ncbi:MAG: hypothetical protein AAEJ04_02610, partial [Planctomycetota bacterium]
EVDRIVEESSGSCTGKAMDVPALSIDHFLLSRPDFLHRLKVRQMSHRWSDLGTWSALRDLFPADPLGNIEIQDVITPATSDPIEVGEPILLGCDDVGVESDGSRQLVALGIQQLGIEISAEEVKIATPGVSAEFRFSGCRDLIVYQQGCTRLQVHGFSNGVVAVTDDVVFVCSEQEMVSGAIGIALEMLSRRSKGDDS